MKLKALIILLLVCGSLAAPNKQKKKKEKKGRKGKFNSVSNMAITSEMCDMDEFKRLHMCIALKKNKMHLKQTVNDYKCLFDRLEQQQPTRKEMRDGKFGISRLSELASYPAAAVASFQDNLDNSWAANQTLTRTLIDFATSRATHRIQKRSTEELVNPCAGDLQKVIIYEGLEKDTGEVLELVHDADAALYQTFYIRMCSNFQASGLQCARHDVIFKTLVYLFPPDVSDEVATRYVRIKGSCALSQ